MEEDPAFGRLLKRHRRAAGLTQAGLAERAACSWHYVSMLERGVRVAHPATIDALAAALALPWPEREKLQAAAQAAPRVVGSPEPPPSPLYGRAREAERIIAQLRDPGVRLLTLTGPGGVGKTALARHAAAALAPGFAHGTAFIDLAAASAPDDVMPAMARALALRETSARPAPQRLLAFLRQRETLLLLDGVERVVAAAPALGDLLTACPRLKLLATSRRPLRLRLEHELRVQPLALPPPSPWQPARVLLQSPALALFVQRARLVMPELAIDDERAAVIADICRRLDGLPLAIELAAARVAHLPLVALRDRLQRRLPLLTGGSRDLPARQQRMRDAIAWSADLLAPPEQALLRQLSVFAGSWSLESAEEICRLEAGSETVLDGMRTLMEGSLIVSAENASDEPRYRMLDTIREFAAEQLDEAGESDLLRRRHSAHFLRLAERAEPALQDRSQRVWHPRLEREHDNLRAALDWLLRTEEAEQALRLAGAIWRFWQRRGDIREGSRWLEAGLASAQPVAEPVRAKALWGASWLAYHQGDYARMRSLSAEHLALARRRDDPLSTRNALTGLGMAALAEGQPAEAALVLAEALAACDPLGETWHRATSLLNLGNATLLAGDLSRAGALFTEALRLYERRGDEIFAARARQHLGYVALRQGDAGRAGTHFAQSLQALFALAEKPGVADGLEAVAAVRAATGAAERAGELAGAASALREQMGVPPLPYLEPLWRPLVLAAAARLGEPTWRAAQQRGGAMPLAEAVARAVAEPD